MAANAQIEEAALRLRAAGASGVPCQPVAEVLGERAAELAYAVQEINTRHWIASGRRIVGRKIGLTARSVQQQLGVDQPDYGILFSDMEVADGATVLPARVLQPRVEAEVAFVIGRDVDAGDVQAAGLARHIDHVLPAIEIVDSRIADWKISFADTVADNASAGLFVLGTTPRSLAGLDLELCGMVLDRNGEAASLGVGAACLGHPLHAAAWLARRMVEVERSLKAGDVILSGALGPMVEARPGDRVEARIAGLGRVRVEFERGDGE